MVGFTLLSQHLSDEELAAVVRRFEEISHDIVTSARGRVVKMIGDEVMFVTDNVADAARIGLDLADAYADDDLLSDVRVGLAIGPVLVRDGDYFGPTVNLAHRIVNIGNPGTVLMSDEFHTRARWQRRPASSPPSPCGRGSSRTWAGCSCGGADGPARRRTAPAPPPTAAATCAGNGCPRCCATSRSCVAWASGCSRPAARTDRRPSRLGRFSRREAGRGDAERP